LLLLRHGGGHLKAAKSSPFKFFNHFATKLAPCGGEDYWFWFSLWSAKAGVEELD